MKTFSHKVVALALAIPPGRVVTYGMIAQRAGGGALAARSITSILAKAYHAGEMNIPWHRIVYAGGRVWLDEEHRVERERLYKREKIELDSKGSIKNFEDLLWDFN